MLEALLAETRTVRTYDESIPVEKESLDAIIKAACLAPSGANRQTTRFRPVFLPEELEKVWPHLRYAAALKDWDGPAAGQRPTGFLLCLSKDKQLTAGTAIDLGLATAYARLRAQELGLSSCIFRAFDQDALADEFSLGEYHVNVVISLGTSSQTVILEETNNPADLNYWMDEDFTHHVPKLSPEQRTI